ncbi:ATP-dependent metallopeptidase FtsH/Yme1/Tma family protein [Thermosulfuriphilus ammonigenes]|uniref:ATP-dependent zinc metalloprotease FtsH n=1 Tax=Thermosulfuriphilus ammonigenes TaxID=1936021 RepID=A0A6G7PWR1_9BACT|nr:ATP-dependent zinc metalloprotease FtsH [Thermosulfuriphilus ammonigenes]MBA2847666.1 cell division protease FtsH [Thermosulfuriphilus ammonigenes]QIJ72124.1 ATP-dependent metallopeptidase FtsH/Yme1/Tma family protein [Thermosulfuriphilus ammonigenes]
MSSFYRNLSLWLIIAIIMVFLFNIFNQPKPKGVEIPYSEFISLVEKGEVEEVIIQGDKIDGFLTNKKRFHTVAPRDDGLINLLKEAQVKINVKPQEETPWYVTLLISWFPMLLLVGVWIFFMRQMQVGGGKALSFGRSRAKMLTGQQIKITFKDVAGVEEAKEEVSEIIEFLRDPKKFTRLGGRIPKGVLLVGPPGTGKTLLAKAIAGEAGVPFFSISGSDFVEMFVGVGAARVRDLFTQAKRHAPCIIFIDEIDAVGRHRGAGLGGGHDEREQTLNQLLVEMDGFESNEGVIVIAATNRPDVLDPALLRPGRFDRQVVVPAPDVKGREEILKVHVKKVPLAEDVNISLIARGTPGFSGADLENLVNEAALLAARKGKEKVSMEEFEEAKDRVLMGRERKSMIISEEEKRITAYHEAGHALVAKLLPGTDPLHKVTIIPRGQALGLTQQLPLDERHTYPKDYLIKRLMILLGGRAAEELVLNQITTGAGNDIERATELARKMVCEWGMSETLGPVSFGKRDEHIFLGKELAHHKDYSETTAVQIDNEIRRLVTDCYEKTKRLLEENINTLHQLAKALLERETLDAKAIDEIMRETGATPQAA